MDKDNELKETLFHVLMFQNLLNSQDNNIFLHLGSFYFKIFEK